MALEFLNDAYFAAKVGIGTESPSVALQLGNSTLGQTELAIFNSEGGGEVGLTIQSRTNRAKLRVADNDSNAYVVAEAGKAFFGTSANGDANNVTVLNTGYVGIGTTTPGEKLHVVGNTFLSANKAYIASYNNTNSYHGSMRWAGLQLGNNGVNKIAAGRTSAGGSFQFWTNNTNDVADYTVTPDGIMTMAMTNVGNVGIGTTSPSSKLELGPNGSLGANITNKNVILNIDGGYGTTGTPSSGQYKVIGFTGTTKDVTDITGQNGGETSKNFYAGIIGGDYFNSNRFSVWQAGVERLTILGTASGSGNVGIGTTSPTEKLHIKSTVSGSFIRFEDNGGSGVYVGSRSNELEIYAGGSERMKIDAAGAIQFNAYNDANNTGTPTYLLGTDGSGNVVKTLSSTAPGSLWLASGNNIYNTNSANVGIGITTPYTKLVIGSRGTAAAPSILAYDGIAFDFHNDGSPYARHAAIISQAGDSTEAVIDFWTKPLNGSNSKKMTLRGDGKLGIGTDDPGEKLEINTAAQSAIMLRARYNASYYTDYGSNQINFTGSNQSFGIKNNGSFAMFVNASSNVGINRTSLVEKFEVEGNIKITAALLSNQENTDVDTGTETVASVAIATYTAAFFDFVIKKTTNVRSGTVYACHDGAGTPLIAFTETSTQDLGDTSDVTLSVDISGGNMRLRATTTSDDWSIKSLIRAI